MVSPYLLVPLVACLVLCVLAAVILARDPAQRAARRAGLLVAGGAWWAFCELLWNTRSDPQAALWLVRASALGWFAIGPLVLELFLEVTGRPAPRLRARLPALYALSVGFLLLDWVTPWVHTGVTRTGWGWAYELGPAYLLFYAYTVACIGIALAMTRSMPEAVSPGERAQARLLGLGMLVPLVIGSLTDGLLPLLGMQPPRLGTSSLAVLAGVIAWSLHRYGYSLLAPGTFADEILGTLPDGVALLRVDGRVRQANASLASLLEMEPRALPGLQIRDHLTLPGAPGQELRAAQCELQTAGGHRRPVAAFAAPLRDKRGDALGLVLVLRDLDEIVTLRQRLALSGRLAAVGEMAAGIAHEINNPLAFVRANLGMLRQHWHELGSELRKHPPTVSSEDLLGEGEDLIDESLEGVDRAVTIVRGVRGLSHAGGGERELAELSDLLDGVVRLAGPQLRGSGAVIERDYAPDVRLECAPHELQQVFLNLLLNAAQALEGPGAIRLSTRLESGWAVACIDDEGSGIAPELVERIFDPFFTTKPVGEGTGLGLGIAYEIVRRHGGEIEVESAPGRGSRFRVRLPVDADRLGIEAGRETGPR